MKNMKKLFAVLLTVIMALGMMTTAFAAEGDVTLTINKANGHTYTVYQMLTGDVSGLTNGTGTLANIKQGTNLKLEEGQTVDLFVDAIKGKTDTEVAAEAKKWITGEGTTYGNQALSVAPGYYVVMDTYKDGTDNGTAYMVAVVGPTTMNPKTSTPPMDKTIEDTDENKALDTAKKTDTAAIGDTINYKLTSEVPVTEGYKYYYYVVNDTLSKGLTLCGKDGFTVMIGNETLNEGTGERDYTLTLSQNADGPDKFELVINDMKKFDAGLPIVITYSAVVNPNAEIGLDPNTNTVNLTYSNNPSDTYEKEPSDDHKPKPGDAVGKTPDSETKTYVTELTLQKTDADSKKFIDALKGATFTLTGTGINDVKVTTETVFVEATADDEQAVKYYLLKDGTYTTEAPVTAEDGYNADKYVGEANAEAKYVTKTVVSCTDNESGSEVSITAVVDTNGQIKFTGLNTGSYKLEETKVPEGYNKAPIYEFTISGEVKDGAFEWTKGGKDAEKFTLSNGVFSATVENQKGTTLPETGGMGTRLFYMIGGLLVVAAGVLLITKRRMATK